MVVIKTARNFPHRLIMPKGPNHWEADKWCRERFGKRWSVVDNRDGVWCCFWLGPRGGENAGKYEWFFLNKEDAILFALRWS